MGYMLIYTMESQRLINKYETRKQKMKAYERFLNYIRVHTSSNSQSETVPTSIIQFDLAKILVEELHSMGVQNARVDDKCYVYASIDASPGYEEKPSLGFIAHIDTSPDFCGENVEYEIIDNYDGSELVLGQSSRTLSPKEFSHLSNLKGRTLITTHGNTLLGADNKAGIAEILTLTENIITKNIPHGKICIGFTPDEEVGSGADHLDLQAFGADFAYTVDGGPEGEISYENFNASSALFEIKGFNVHPGEAKDTMINASLVAAEINSMLPSGETPRDTQDYEGFFHMTSINGNVEHATMEYIIRDHDIAALEARKSTLMLIVKLMNEKYGEGSVILTIKDQYRNMAEKIKPCFHLIDNAAQASRKAGVEPVIIPVRGGTDGANLSFKGLPCPNLGTGGYAFHGPYEHITVEAMDKTVEILENIVEIYAHINF